MQNFEYGASHNNDADSCDYPAGHHGNLGFIIFSRTYRAKDEKRHDRKQD
jgi:hypothetical protein